MENEIFYRKREFRKFRKNEIFDNLKEKAKATFVIGK